VKARERLAAFVITIGLSILVLLGLWIWAQLASRRRVRGYRGEPLIDIPLPRDPETLMWIATIGGSITLLGVLMTLLIYLTRGWGHERTHAHAKVLALFATDRDGQVVVSPAGLPPNALRYYVHLELPNGSVDEFECSFALYRQLLEGRTGAPYARATSYWLFTLTQAARTSNVRFPSRMGRVRARIVPLLLKP
jgi:hypothetical protein